MHRVKHRTRVGAGVASCFAVGLTLANKVIEGEKTDWVETGALGWGLLAGTAIGFPLGLLVQGWLKARLTTQTTPWVLLGLALGSLCGLVILAVSGGLGSSLLDVDLGVATIGLWAGFLLGIAFGHLSSAAEPQG